MMRMRFDLAWSYFILRPVFKTILSLFFSLEIENAAVLKQVNGPVILAGNHTGFLDGPIVLSAFNRPVRFLTLADVLHWPVVGWLLKQMGVIPVHRGKSRQALQTAVECIDWKQNNLCIFPEGRLSPDGKMGSFQKGVIHLHQKTQATIVPFAIHGGYESWPWGQWLPKPRKLFIRFGEPFVFQQEPVSVEILHKAVLSLKTILEERDNGMTLLTYPVMQQEEEQIA